MTGSIQREPRNPSGSPHKGLPPGVCPGPTALEGKHSASPSPAFCLVWFGHTERWHFLYILDNGHFFLDAQFGVGGGVANEKVLWPSLEGP